MISSVFCLLIWIFLEIPGGGTVSPHPGCGPPRRVPELAIPGPATAHHAPPAAYRPPIRPRRRSPAPTSHRGPGRQASSGGCPVPRRNSSRTAPQQKVALCAAVLNRYNPCAMLLRRSQSLATDLVIPALGVSPGRSCGPLRRNRPTSPRPASMVRSCWRSAPGSDDVGRILAAAGTLTLGGALLSHVNLLSRETGQAFCGAATRIAASDIIRMTTRRPRNRRSFPVLLANRCGWTKAMCSARRRPRIATHPRQGRTSFPRVVRQTHDAMACYAADIRTPRHRLRHPWSPPRPIWSCPRPAVLARSGAAMPGDSRRCAGAETVDGTARIDSPRRRRVDPARLERWIVEQAGRAAATTWSGSSRSMARTNSPGGATRCWP